MKKKNSLNLYSFFITFNRDGQLTWESRMSFARNNRFAIFKSTSNRKAISVENIFSLKFFFLTSLTKNSNEINKQTNKVYWLTVDSFFFLFYVKFFFSSYAHRCSSMLLLFVWCVRVVILWQAWTKQATTTKKKTMPVWSLRTMQLQKTINRNGTHKFRFLFINTQWTERWRDASEIKKKFRTHIGTQIRMHDAQMIGKKGVSFV